jgi:hypothetical protein
MKIENASHLVKHFVIQSISHDVSVKSGDEESRIYNKGKLEGLELSLAIMDIEKCAHAALRHIKEVQSENEHNHISLSCMMSIIKGELKVGQ